MTDTKTRVHNALDYRARIQSDPRYDLSDIYPQTGNRTLGLNATQTRQIDFEIPPRCVNLSRCLLEFDVEATVTSTASLNQTVHIPSDHLSPIERIEVFTRTGVRLMDLDQQQVWSKISNSYFAGRTDYEAAGAADSDFQQQVKSKFIKTQTTQSVVNDDIHNINKQTVGLKPLTKFPWKKTTPGVSTHLKKISIDLSHFRDSILSVDKSLYFGGQVLIVKLTIAPTNSWIFQKTTATTGPTVGDTDGGPFWTPGGASTSKLANQSDFAAAITDVTYALKDVTMRCAFESNPVLISQIKSKVMTGSGLKLFFPYTYSWVEPKTQSSGKISHIVRFNRGYGLRLQRIVWTATNVNILNPLKASSDVQNTMAYQQTDSATPVANVQPLIKSYYTTLNNRRLQERDLIVTDSKENFTSDTFDYAKQILEKSVCNSQLAMLDNWAHVDAFDAYSADKKDFSNVIAGLPLSDDMQYAISAEIDSQSASMQTSVFAVCQRSLQLKADSVTVV